MRVTRLQIVARGLTNRCPNCGGRTLFQPGRVLDVVKECPRCGLKIEQDEGFFMGSMSLNFGVTLVGFMAPLALLAYFHVISGAAAGIAAGVGAIVVPLVLYRSSRSWWLMNYYVFLPDHLPANKEPGRAPPP